MRKLLFALATILLMSAKCFASCDVTIDGYQYCDFDVSEYNGLISAPDVSPSGKARIYFDSGDGTLKCSEDGGAYTNCVGGGGGGSGTVTSVAVASANGFSGSVANPNTTPVITLSAGAITPTSVNGVVFSGSSTPTLAVTGTSSISGSNTGDQTITLTGAVTGTGTGAITTTMNSNLDSLTDVVSSAPVTGDHLIWNGTNWIPSATTSVVGSASSFYLDATASLADNFTLSISPSAYAETINTKTVLIATSPVFFERFVSPPLGRTSIPAGTWRFETYAAADSDAGTQEVKFRVNRRHALTGMTGTFTGAGATRTFTVTGGTPFVAGDANASRLLAGLIETPTQTAWISGFTSSSVVTVTLTDASFVNVSDTPLNAIYYYLFDTSTLADRDMAGATPDLYTTTVVEPAFTGFSDTDRLVIAYFGSSNNDTGTDTMRLYYGGVVNFTHFDSPISTLHNDLAGLNVGDYMHLTAAEYANVPRLSIASGKVFTSSNTITLTGTDSVSMNVSNIKLGGICFHFGNGTDVITTGEKKAARHEVKKGGTITGWTILSLDDTSGSIGLDVWKDTYANYPPTVADTITASAKPSVTTATKNTSTTLTGWTTTFSAGDVLSVNVDSVTSMKDVELCLDVTWN